MRVREGDGGMKKPYAVEMEKITKTFGGVHALKEVSFQNCKGNHSCAVGENGAGKSTLMKILSGAYTKDRRKDSHRGKRDFGRQHFGNEKGRRGNYLSGICPCPGSYGGGKISLLTV